jgi:hypothetical protein
MSSRSCHSLFLRGENVKNFELPDMFSLRLENESPSQTSNELVAILDRGKTNSFGKLDYAGGIRHARVEACTIGAVAFHFLRPESSFEEELWKRKEEAYEELGFCDTDLDELVRRDRIEALKQWI